MNADERRMTGQWRGRPERGSSGAIRLIVWLALHAGRGLCRMLLVPICAYFFVTAPVSRRSSRDFLGLALGRRARWRDTFRHLFAFSTTLLDRVYLLNGRHREITVEIANDRVFWDALAMGRGCLLLGSHLGSFEMLGVVGSVEKNLAINMVMHIDDHAKLGGLIAGAHIEPPYNVIPLGQPGSMLRVRECLERGEVIGILADRVYGDEPTMTMPFLGRPARFSLSPLRLARITGAPVVLVFGLFRGGRRYEILFESLAERVVENNDGGAGISPPGLEHYLRRYVESLERHARSAPYNWFNFYDYWSA